ncbi:MAG TPA: hypothetical protein VK791_09560 [bacterium]|jgi:hypothetical protein|nr:hypothetical protein [bacterium]
MNFFRKQLIQLSAIALFSFCFVSVAENFHHHSPLESQDDCAFCGFIQTASHAVSMPQAPVLVPGWVVLSLFTIQVSFTSFRAVSPRGRSPPQILL